MTFDFKKEYKELYSPKDKPEIIKIPKMNFIAVEGKGNPNDVDGEYQKALELLYSIAYTLKMSYMGEHKIDGYFKYVVPPLEGFWWQDNIKGVDYSKKDLFKWISLIRIPDFISLNDFEWAIIEATKKKKLDYTKVKYYSYDEGLCVQCLHKGPYDDELQTVYKMHQYIENMGYELDISKTRYHHEIYLSDPRKGKKENMKTILRHPIKKIDKI